MLDSNEPALPAQDDGRESHSDGPDHNQTKNVYANDNDGPDPKSEGGESKKMNPCIFWILFPSLCLVAVASAVIMIGVSGSLVHAYFTNSTMTAEQGIRNTLGLGLLTASAVAFMFFFEMIRQIWTKNPGEKKPKS